MLHGIATSAKILCQRYVQVFEGYLRACFHVYHPQLYIWLSMPVFMFPIKQKETICSLRRAPRAAKQLQSDYANVAQGIRRVASAVNRVNKNCFAIIALRVCRNQVVMLN